MPALPLDEAGKYVAAAYVVFLALVVVYVAIMAVKLQRIERDLRELAEVAEERAEPEPRAAPERGSERPTMSDSLASHGSGGGGV